LIFSNSIEVNAIARWGGLLLGGLLLAALAIMVPLASPAQPIPAGEDPNPGAVQFHIDTDSSWLRVLVYRGGLLRGFGHNHVISHNGITGTVMVTEDLLQSSLVLEFRVADLVVDEAELRVLEGADFRRPVSQKDIAGTQANMLGRKLLQAVEFPSIQVRSERITGSMPNMEVEASVIVRGTEFTLIFPAYVERSNDSLIASGEKEIGHSDIGLSPFKAALGTLRVRDTLLVKYEISATRTVAPE
jgi:hypothetical protein